MPSSVSLRLYPTQASVHKAGLHLCSFEGGRTVSLLYVSLPQGEKKPTFPLSIAKQRWIAEHDAQVTKLGRFSSGGFHILQTRMIRHANQQRDTHALPPTRAHRRDQ